MISPWRVEAGGSSGPGALGSWREHHEAACPTLPTGGSNHSWDFCNTSAWIGIAPQTSLSPPQLLLPFVGPWTKLAGCGPHWESLTKGRGWRVRARPPKGLHPPATRSRPTPAGDTPLQS